MGGRGERMALTIKPKKECRWDLVSLGEVMVRLDPGERRIATARSFANLEGSRRGNAPLARIEPHHDLAQADQVPAAFFLRLDRQCHALTSAAHPNEKLLPAHSHEITGMFPHSRLHFSSDSGRLHPGHQSMDDDECQQIR